MTPNEAIIYLGLIYSDRKDDGVGDDVPGQKAIRLGIEALERCKHNYLHPVQADFRLLPSETTE